jgi:hypothetical protein
MKRQWLNTTVVVATIFGLTACAQVERQEGAAPARIAEAEPEADFEEWALVVKGVPIQRLVEDRERLREAVIELVDTDNQGQISEWVAVVRSRDGNAADVPLNLRGLAGFSAVQLLESYVATFSGLDAQRRVSGKIVDYIFDDAEKAGHLAVNTKIEYFDTSESYASEVPDDVKRYHWDIEVTKGTYLVVPHSGDRNDPFPGTLALVEPTLTNIETRELDHKLWAKGTGIVVRHVYEVFSDGSIARLPDTHPFYMSTEASCIDMMFKGYPPAIRLPVQRFYCLGRCDHPEVVNTD